MASKLFGYCAVFGKRSCDLGGFIEVIQPGAFKAALARCDVRALFNHDPSMLLGRSSAGTLRLVEDSVGLRVEIDTPDTTLGRDVAESIRRRDLQGQSFSFTTRSDSWDFSGSIPVRTLLEVDQLLDVGPVSFPAYEQTTMAARSVRPSGRQGPSTSAEVRRERESDRDRVRLIEIS